MGRARPASLSLRLLFFSFVTPLHCCCYETWRAACICLCALRGLGEEAAAAGEGLDVDDRPCFFAALPLRLMLGVLFCLGRGADVLFLAVRLVTARPRAVSPFCSCSLPCCRCSFCCGALPWCSARTARHTRLGFITTHSNYNTYMRDLAMPNSN